MTTFAAIALGVALAAAPPARADDDVQTAKRAYDLGYRALQDKDYAEALVHYEESYRLAPRPRTRFNIAVCQEALGQLADAWRSYRTFVEQAEARDAAFVDDARQHIAALRMRLTGRVRVESTPRGAAVRVDGNGRARGRTPAVLELPPGRHRVVVTLPGAAPAARTVDVLPDEEASVTVALDVEARVVIHVQPETAEIVRAGGDGETIARGAFEGRLDAGTHEIVVRAPGFREQRITVEAEPGQTQVHHVSLLPAQQSAVLTVRAPGAATLSVDGRPARPLEAGDGAAAPAVLTPGTHDLRVERPGHHPWVDTLHLSRGESVEVDVDLRRRRSRRLRWGVAGLGTASIAGGAVLGVQALRDVTSDSPDRHDRGKLRALGADGLMLAGVTTLVVTWWMSKRSSSATVRRAHGGTR